MILNYGYKIEHRNGKNQIHREDGPAVEYQNGTKMWYQNGRLHREDGPAIEWSSGQNQFYLNNIRLTEDEFNLYKFFNNL